MAYTTLKNEMVLTFRDVREQDRLKIIELGGLVVLTDDDAEQFDAVSKSAVRKYAARNVQSDAGKTPDADSEVRDTLRLYFRMPSEEIYHLDIPDPHDELFLSTTGPGANIVKDYADMAAAGPTTPEHNLTLIIDKVLAGSILISDGEQATTYLSGERVTWR